MAHASLRAVMSELDSARAAIEAAPSDPTPGSTALRVALTKSATFGLRGVFPASRYANDPAARAELMAFGARASGELHRRDSAAVAGSAGLRAVFAALFGKGLPIVPRFMAASSDLLAPALASEPDLGSDGDEFVESWLSGVARVRDGVDAWRHIRLCARAIDRPMPRPRIVQLPFDAAGGTPRWAAREFASVDARPSSGLVSLALFGAVPASDAVWSGLLIDAWPELLPALDEDAGVVFHYDAPGGQAPQCVLLAVPPPDRESWSYELIEETLLDTLALAKLRTVDLSGIGRLGQILPMAYLAANAANGAISTSFTGLMAADAVIQPITQ